MGLSNAQIAYLDDLEDSYDATGIYPKVIRSDLINAEFEKGMKFRGLPPIPEASLDKVTPTQRAVVRLLTDITDRRPIRTKLTSLGVTTAEYNKWKRNPKFQEHLNSYVSKCFSDVSTDAKLAISKLILDGDLQAIKYYHELTGQHTSSDQTTLNLTLVISKMMEVLIRHLEPAMLQTIADELDRSVFQASIPATSRPSVQESTLEIAPEPLPVNRFGSVADDFKEPQEPFTSFTAKPLEPALQRLMEEVAKDSILPKAVERMRQMEIDANIEEALDRPIPTEPKPEKNSNNNFNLTW